MLWILLGFYGDMRDEYSGIEMGTGSTQAIWGVAMLKKVPTTQILYLHNAVPLAKRNSR